MKRQVVLVITDKGDLQCYLDREAFDSVRAKAQHEDNDGMPYDRKSRMITVLCTHPKKLDAQPQQPVAQQNTIDM